MLKRFYCKARLFQLIELYVYIHIHILIRIHTQTALDLTFFDFAMLQKRKAFSRNHTSNFEF